MATEKIIVEFLHNDRYSGSLEPVGQASVFLREVLAGELRKTPTSTLQALNAEVSITNPGGNGSIGTANLHVFLEDLNEAPKQS